MNLENLPRMTDEDLRKGINPESVSQQVKDNPLLNALNTVVKQRQERTNQALKAVVNLMNEMLDKADLFNYFPYSDNLYDPDNEESLEVGEAFYDMAARYCRVYNARQLKIKELRENKDG